jgi:hypothetical protein
MAAAAYPGLDGRQAAPQPARAGIADRLRLVSASEMVAREPPRSLRLVRRRSLPPKSAAAFGSFTNETYFGRTDGKAHRTRRADRTSRNQRDCGLDIRQSNLGAGRGIRLPKQPRATHFGDKLGSRRNRRWRSLRWLAPPRCAAKRVLVPVPSPPNEPAAESPRRPVCFGVLATVAKTSLLFQPEPQDVRFYGCERNQRFFDGKRTIDDLVRH